MGEGRGPGAPASGGRPCPFCGGSSAAAGPPEVGVLTVDEFAILARNEWRRRLGAGAHPRRHSPDLVRALVVFAMRPESPVRRLVLEAELTAELAALRASGLSRRQIEEELIQLSHAIWDVLAASGIPTRRAVELMEWIDGTILASVAWWGGRPSRPRRYEGGSRWST